MTERCKHGRKYSTFNYRDAVPGGQTLLTGVRGVTDKPHKVYISGFYTPAPSQEDQRVKSFIYKGCLCGKGCWSELYYPGSPTTNLYGPNNGPNNGLKKNTIQVVGNYTAVDGDNSFPVGCLYQGKLNGSGEWTSLTPDFPDQEVLGVIAHSNMGGLVVGNYDTQKAKGRAFIYDIKKKLYQEIVKSEAISITAYGIWHNGCNSYTICGGYKDKLESEAGYLVDWDNKKQVLSNWRSYHFDNDPVRSRITHFDGITGDKCGYNLTGDWLGVDKEGVDKEGDELAFFASVTRDPCTKRFGPAKWESISFPLEGSRTSGNTVYQDTVIGVYTTPVGVNGYIAQRK